MPLDNFIKPILGEQRLAGSEYPENMMLVVITVIVLLGALIHHLFAAKIMGGGYKASDHIRHAPLLEGIYNAAEKRAFDPYDIGLKIVNVISKTGWWVDRAIDWLYDDLSVRSAGLLADRIKSVHTGNYSMYILWTLFGAGFVLIMLMKSL